eukprot:TRINITY_DN33454_c0_g1_i3.p1 TRINITY_DN33454_c0_g1~~TRINITY_DN33454_c0_g1_i3.p1  ORF type:complete len:848 (-),score=177.82 TRINITY_DN33454_c0_g1_i3:119-2662(-)
MVRRRGQQQQDSAAVAAASAANAKASLNGSSRAPGQQHGSPEKEPIACKPNRGPAEEPLRSKGSACGDRGLLKALLCGLLGAVLGGLAFLLVAMNRKLAAMERAMHEMSTALLDIRSQLGPYHAGHTSNGEEDHWPAEDRGPADQEAARTLKEVLVELQALREDLARVSEDCAVCASEGSELEDEFGYPHPDPAWRSPASQGPPGPAAAVGGRGRGAGGLLQKPLRGFEHRSDVRGLGRGRGLKGSLGGARLPSRPGLGLGGGWDRGLGGFGAYRSSYDLNDPYGEELYGAYGHGLKSRKRHKDYYDRLLPGGVNDPYWSDDFGHRLDDYKDDWRSNVDGRSKYVPDWPTSALKREFKNRTRAIAAALRFGPVGPPLLVLPEQWRIPCVIHQTWKTGAVPAKYAHHMATWRQLHPHWRAEFWNDQRGRELVAKHFPKYLRSFEAMSGIKKADVMRVVILYIEGGVYADIDVEAVKPLDPLLAAAAQARAGVLLGEENFVHAVLLERRSTWLVSNAVMASAKGHPFWLEVLDAIFEDSYCGDDPVQCTGPRLLDRLSWRHVRQRQDRGGGLGGSCLHEEYGCLTRLPYVYFSPQIARWNAGNMVKECNRGGKSDAWVVTWQSARLKREAASCAALERALQQPEALQSVKTTYAVHHWQCSWCRKDDSMRDVVSIDEVAWIAGNTSVGGVQAAVESMLDERRRAEEKVARRKARRRAVAVAKEAAAIRAAALGQRRDPLAEAPSVGGRDGAEGWRSMLLEGAAAKDDESFKDWWRRTDGEQPPLGQDQNHDRFGYADSDYWERGRLDALLPDDGGLREEEAPKLPAGLSEQLFEQQEDVGDGAWHDVDE